MKKLKVMFTSGSLDIGGMSKIIYLYCKYLNKDFFEPHIYIYGEDYTKETRLDKMKKYAKFARDVEASEQKLIDYINKNDIDIIHGIDIGNDFSRKCYNKSNAKSYIATDVFGLTREMLLRDVKVIKRDVGKDISEQMNHKIKKLESLSELIDKKLFISYYGWVRRLRKELAKKSEIKKYRKNMQEEEIREFEKKLFNVVTELFKENKIVFGQHDEEDEFFLDDKTKLRKELGLPTDCPLIGTIGQFHAGEWNFSKQHEKMLREIKKDFPNVKYVIYGKCHDYEKDIVEKFKSTETLSSVIYKGYVPESEKKKYLAALDIFVHPTNIKMFGFVFVEAMACKLPVITNSYIGMPDQNAMAEVINDGRTGILVPLEDYKNLTKAVKLLLENKEMSIRMGEEGYKKIKKDYDGVKVSKSLEKIYITTLQEKNIPIEKEIEEYYENIDFYPSKEDIFRYIQNYINMASCDFIKSIR